jgi:Domain of unknown function (DUF4279)
MDPEMVWGCILETFSMISSTAVEANPNCAETFASLRLYGDALVPEDISRVIHLEPTDSASKGMKIVVSSGKSRSAPTGRWIVQTRGKISSANLEEHIKWILDRLEQFSISVENLPGVERADIFCYWRSATGQGGPEFSPEVLDRLAKNRLRLGLDFYS